MAIRIYQAGPLFNDADRQWHQGLTKRLRDAGFAVTWPGDLFDAQELADMGHAAKEHIFGECRKHLEHCDVVVALLDGTQVDDGTAWEIGYAYAKGVPVFGIRTDFRNAGDTEHSLVNCMIECACENVATNIDALLEVLKNASL